MQPLTDFFSEDVWIYLVGCLFTLIGLAYREYALSQRQNRALRYRRKVRIQAARLKRLKRELDERDEFLAQATAALEDALQQKRGKR